MDFFSEGGALDAGVLGVCDEPAIATGQLFYSYTKCNDQENQAWKSMSAESFDDGGHET